MRLAWSEQDVRDGFEATKREGLASFGDDRVFIEKFIESPRHIEIQLLGDQHGNIVYLGERECSIQRRHQKVVEEAPSPFVTPEMRRAMGEQAVALAAAVGYYSAGTVELIVSGADKTGQGFYFLEMNTRLQVEHPVTEEITGLDLVEQMIRVAYGEKLAFGQDDVKLNGWAMESRVYAEAPYRNFLPSTGRLTRYAPPPESRTSDAVVRVDTGVFEGGEVSMFYDPMIAKLVTWAPTRAAAIDLQIAAIDRYEIAGVGTNLDFLSALSQHPRFRSGKITTGFIAEEYPEGFHGAPEQPATLQAVAAAAAAIAKADAVRALHVDGQLGTPLEASDRWVVRIDGEEHDVTLEAEAATIDGRQRQPVAGLSAGRGDRRGRGRRRDLFPADRAQARLDDGDHGRPRAKSAGGAAAGGRAPASYDREGRARHVALPGVADAGVADAADGAARRQGRGGPAARDRRGDEDGEYAARREIGDGVEGRGGRRRKPGDRPGDPRVRMTHVPTASPIRSA